MRSAIFTFVAATTITTSAVVAGSWLVQEEISPLDDSKNIVLWTESLEPIPDTFGRLVTPILVLRCQENTTSIYMNWSTYLGIDESRITYRIDKLPAETHTWRISTNFEAIGLWSGGSAIPFINRLFGRKTLLARITPYGESPVTAVFNIEGLETAAAPLMEACHWQPRASRIGPAPQKQPAPPKQEDEFAALLRSVEEMDRQTQGELRREGAGRSADAAGQARTTIGDAGLSFGEIDALRRQIGGCWTLPVGIEGIEDMVVRLRIQVRPDRTVQRVTVQDQTRLNRDPAFRAVAESARQAVEKCSPLNLPPGKHAVWRDIDMNFHPEDAISG